ncbi:MAG: ubiquinone/menaquinone biosynthesis methyltransferase [Chloroflexi bacterium]|nr:ubiquinone/menaquinone biosynthesis methyltransferase [Chloroflexota bacterium]
MQTNNRSPKTIKTLFDRLARFYDRVNRVMSWGQDERWRRLTVRMALGSGREWALDVAAGTGRLSLALAREYRNVAALDMSLAMMAMGKERLKNESGAGRVSFVQGDALLAPFPDSTFDCATIGFATRNVADLRRCLAEMRRVVKPAGRVVCLELSHPPHSIINAPFQLYLHRIVPFLGQIIAGQPGAYRWLGRSLRDFPPAGELKKLMEEVGLRDVGFRRLQFGTVAIHWGTK